MKFSLKLFGAIMTIALVLCLATSVFAAVDVSQFTDFPTGSWSEPALKAGVENGLINGKGDGRIAPKDYITRAETAAIINRAFGATVKADISKYTDVSSDKWYYADMQKAVNMQTVQGVSNTELRPDGYITREQVFAILARALVITDTNETKLMTFSDGASVSSWARGYTAALVNRGYVNGNAENRLKPQDYITREEFAQVMYNIFKQYIEGYNAKLSDATFGTTVVRTPNLTLKNLVINGDLIIADGVGSGNLTLENVKVSGRILFRGGEGKVKLTKTTVGEFVRIHDVNGVVNFQNYEDEAVFKNHIQDTKATFLKKSSGGGGGGGSTTEKKDYTIRIHKQKVTDEPDAITKAYDTTSSTVSAKAGKVITYTPEDIEGFSVDAGKSVLTGENDGSLVIEVYYNRNKYNIEFNGSTYPFLYGQKLFDGTTLGDALSAFISSQKDAGYDVAYTFDGSAVDPDSDKTASKNGTVEITKTPIQYKVTYDLGAADAYFDTTPDGNITVEETLTLPTPKRAGYEFVAWYLDSALTQPVTEISVGTTSDITVYAEWRLASVPATKYTITYNGVGYEVEEGEPLSSNASLKAAMDATTEKTGYTLSFEGTYTKNGSAVTTPVTTSTPAVADMEIKAVYTAIEYTITYYSNGMVYGTATYTIEDAVTLPVLTDSANDFNGWFADSAFTNGPVTAIAVGTTGNKTFYAKWTPKDVYFIMTYEGIEYPIKAGERLDSNQDLINALNTAVQKPGYLLRWKGYYMENGQEKWTGLNISTVPDRDMTIKPDYTLSYYGIWLYSNGTQYQEIRYCIYDEVILPVPTDVAYFFNGWYDNEQFTGTPVTKIEAGTTGSIHLYAKWTPKAKYTITYNGVEYNAYEDQKIKDAVDANGNKLSDALATYVVPEGYERDGYKIKGTDVSVDLEANASQTIELEPKNKVIVYTITYYSNGVVYGTATYTVEDAVTLPVLADSANDFNGWFADSAFTNGPVTAIAVGTTGNKEFYAKWTPKTTPATMYTITFNGVDYEVEEGKPLYTNASLKTAMEAAEKDGYTVSFKNADTSATVTVDTVASADMEIEAVYTLIKYTITYMYGGTEVLTKGEYTVEDSVTLPTYSKVGYNFDGWYEDEALTSGPVTAIAVGTTGNKVYYAKLTLKPNPEIGFSYEKDEANNKVTVYVELSAMPKNIDDLAAMSIYYTQSPKNMTLVSAEPLFVAGSFAYSDGALVWINQNDSITESELIANDGRLFKLVYSYTHPTNGDVVLSYADSTELASSTYKIGTGYTKADATIPFADSYTVTFNGTEYVVEEGKALSSNASLKAAMGATEEKTGYTLSFKNVATSDVVTVDTLASADMEIEAVYTAIEYTITYYSNGVVYATATYTIEESVTLPVLTDASNSFDGWYTDSAFTSGPVTAIAVGTTGNKEFYAKWTPVTEYFTVTFDGMTYQVEAGQALSTNNELKVAMEAVTKKTGYTLSFEGTYTLGGLETTEEVALDSLVNADMTIEAKYTAIKYTITYMYNGTEVLTKVEYTIEDTVTLSDYSVEGYTFHGWFEDEAFTSGPVTEIPVGTTGDKVYYAYLVEIPDVPDIFTVSFYEGTKKFKGSYDVEEGTTLTQADVDAFLGDPANYSMQEGYTDSDGNVHKIAPELWYMVDGEWETYDPETVVIDRDIDVHLFTRFAAFYYDTNLKFKGVKIPRIELTIAYDSNTPITHSYLDTLAAMSGVLEGTIDNIETATGIDLFQTALNAAAKFKIVDENGNIVNPEVPVPLHKLITEELIMEQIDNYIDANLGNEEFIAEILRNDTVVKMLLEDESIRNKVLSDESMRNKLLTDSVIKEMISKDSVIDWIFNSTDFKQKFIDSDETFEYIISDIKDLMTNDDYHKMIIDACVEFVMDVYFEETKHSDALVNYIDSVLDSDTFIKQIEENKELRPLFKEEIKSLIAELSVKPSTDPTKQEIYNTIRTNATIKQSIIDSVTNNEDVMANLRSEVREDLKKAPADSKYRALVTEVIRSEFASASSELKDGIIGSIKDDLKSSTSSMRAELIKAVKEDLDKGTASTLKDDIVDAVKKDLSYDTDDDASTVSTLKASVIGAVQEEFKKAQSDIKDKIIDSVMDDFSSSTSVLKDKILTAIEKEFEKTDSEFKDTIIKAVEDDFASSTSVLKDKILTAIKAEFQKTDSEFKDTVIDAVKDDFDSPVSVLKDKVITAIEEDFANGGSLKTEIVNKVTAEVKTAGSSLRDSILDQLADSTSDVAGMVKDYVKADNGTIKSDILDMAKDDAQNSAIKDAAKDWIETNIATAKSDIHAAAMTSVEALKVVILQSGATTDDAEATQYAEDYISGAIASDVKDHIDDEVDAFFADNDKVFAMVNDNFDTFYSASVDTLFDKLYADDTVFNAAYESFAGVAGKLEETFDKYIENSVNLENAVNTFIMADGKLTEAINEYVKDPASLNKAIEIYVDDADRLEEAVNFYVDDADRLSEAVDFYVSDKNRLKEAVDFYVEDADRLSEAVEFYVDDEDRLKEAIDFYIDDDTRLKEAIDFYIEDEDRLTNAINTYIDTASDDDIESAIDTYIENDDNLIFAVNKYIEDDAKLVEIFNVVKGNNANLMKAFDEYIKNDENLDEAFNEFTKDAVAFDNFYEKHLGANADDPELFNTLFEDYYHSHVHEVAKSAYDEAVMYKDYVSNPADPDNDAKLEKKALYDLIMDYVYDYTDKLVIEYANDELEANHPELVDTIDELMHTELPGFIRSEYSKPDSEIKKTVDELIEKEGKKLIDQYVSGNITDPKTLDFIDDTIKENITVIVDGYIDGTLRDDIKQLVDDEIESYMNKLINDYINNVGDARKTLGELVPTYAKDAVDTLKATDAFKNTISDFTSGNGVRVNEGNIMFISILSELMGEYDYETLMADFAPASVKTITDKVGKELASKYVNALLDTFVSGIKEAEASLQADIDNGIEGTEYRFTTTPRLRVYFMEDFVAAPYNKVSPKIAEKLNAIDLIAINPYAQRLVNMNLIEEYLDYDASAATEELSGYSVKKGYYDEIDEVYGSPIVRYYDIELSHKILLHDAIMWYGKDYLGHATVEAKLNAISALLGTYANEANEAIVEYLQTGELPEDFIGKFLGKNGAIDSAYDKAEDIYYQNEDKILQLADKIDEFYMEKLNKDYTEVIDLAEISVYADGKAYPVYGILLELYGEGDAFTIDALATAIFDSDNYLGINAIENGLNKVKKAIVDKFGYKPGTYTNKIVRDAYKAELEARSIKGISTGSHSVEVQRYFQYIK